MCTDKDEGPRRRSSVEWVRDCANVAIFGIRFRYYGLAEDKRAKGVGWQGPLNNQRQRGERSVGRSTRLKFSYLVTHRCIRLEEVVKSFINRRSFRLGGPEQERRQTHGAGRGGSECGKCGTVELFRSLIINAGAKARRDKRVAFIWYTMHLRERVSLSGHRGLPTVYSPHCACGFTLYGRVCKSGSVSFQIGDPVTGVQSGPKLRFVSLDEPEDIGWIPSMNKSRT